MLYHIIKLNMKRIVVITGIYGHLGRALAIALSKDENTIIRGLALPNEKMPEELKNVPHELIRGDITNIDSMESLFTRTSEEQDIYFVHAAGLITIFKKMTDLLYNVNVNGTKNTLDLSLKHHVKRYIYISSVDAFVAKKGATIREAEHFEVDKLKGAYAKLKAIAGNMIIDEYSDKLDAVIVHPSAIIGPYDKGHNLVIKLCANYLKKGHVAGATGGFDFVDVRDVANGIENILKYEKVARCYILSNHYYTIKELLYMTKDIAKLKHRPIIFPLFLAKLFAPFIEFFAWHMKKRPLFTPYALRTISLHTTYSRAKAKRDLDYVPRPIEETMQDMISYLEKK